MPARAEIFVSIPLIDQYTGAGRLYEVQTASGARYHIFIDTGSDVFYKKSVDGGLSWGQPISIFTGTVIAVSLWYDGWSGGAGGKIHIVYTETGGSDILYRSIDTASADALSTQTTVFAGSSAIAGGALTIWRERNGDLRVAGAIDAGTEDGAWSSTDVGATWGDTIADPSEGGTTDQYLGLPGWNADTADGMIIFWDASADELSVKRYDDSANSWAETSIAATMVDTTAANTFPHYAAAVDIVNSRNVVVAWSRVDFATAKLRCWTITDSAITEVTNVVSSSTDDQGLCAIAIDVYTGRWYVFYCGKTDGSESWNATINVYYKVSQDSGTTWGAETLLSLESRQVAWLSTTPLFSGDWSTAWQITAPRGEIHYSVSYPRSRARIQIGM